MVDSLYMGTSMSSSELSSSSERMTNFSSFFVIYLAGITLIHVLKMILSIDIGIRNLGYAKWDNGILDFGVIDLHDYYKGTDYPRMIKKLVETGFFKGADTILVENQMSSRMKLLACAIRCFFWDKTRMIAPQSVKRHFSSGTKKHSTNKKKAKEIVLQFLDGHHDKFMRLKKKDDVADAVLQLMYFINR